MRTTWRVEKVTSIEGQTTAELVKVEWFIRNPAYTAMMEEYDALVESVGKEEADRITNEDAADDEWIEEFLDVEPNTEGADYIESGDGTSRLTLDITDGLVLAPGDVVIITIDAFARVDA